MRRAYSLLHIKQVEGSSGRTITGIATTPEVDRMGDEVVTTGIQFANPIPLLLFHDSTKPVGLATLGKPSKDGLTFQATIPDPASIESATLRERIIEAIDSISAGLIKGVSIGFRPLGDAIESIESGLRFLKTELLELSLVVIPANASAGVISIKQLATFDTPASVPGPPPRAVVTLLPGATGSRQGGVMKSYADQITGFENTRAAKVSERDAIQAKAAEEGRTKNEDEKQKFDLLTTEIESIDSELKDLRVLESAQAAAAKPIKADTPEQASASRGTSVVQVKDTLPPGIEFVRYARCLAMAGGNNFQAAEIAKEQYPDQPRLYNTLRVGPKQIQQMMKAAVAAGTATDTTWAGPLVQYTDFAGDFIDFLRPQTIVGKFGTNGIPPLNRVPFNVRIKGQTSGGDADWVGEGAPKPLTKFDFTSVLLRWTKLANIAVLTEELIRFSSPSAETLVRTALADALIARLDTDFVDPAKAAVADVSPASITNGITAIASSGTNLAAVYTDVQAIMRAFITNNLSLNTGVWIMSPTRALALSLMRNALGQREFETITMNGGTFQGLPVIVSNYVRPAGSPDSEIVILLSAQDVYLADDGQVTIDMSTEASLQMDDAPTNSTAAGSPLAPVATSVVSLWQTDSVGFRCHRFINWQRRRDIGVQYLDNVRWTA